LVFDYAEHDLFEIIKYHREHYDEGIRLSDVVIKSFLWQMINGIYYLHSNWIMHRDLKPSNILVMGEGREEGTVKIADFGLARIYQSPLRPLSDNGVVVTSWYRPPELLLGAKHYTEAVDMWAIGCIFAELQTLKPLFPGKEERDAAFQEDQLDRIFRVLGVPSPQKWPALLQMPEWKRAQNLIENKATQNSLSRVVDIDPHSSQYDLLYRLLCYDPSSRITAPEALSHTYFAKGLSQTLNVFAGMGQAMAYPHRQKLNQQQHKKRKT